MSPSMLKNQCKLLTYESMKHFKILNEAQNNKHTY